MAKAARPRTVTGQMVRQVRPIRRKHHYVRNFFLTLLFLFILMLVGALATFLIVYATTEVPKPAEFARAQVTSVYYSDGATEIGKFAEVNREIIDTKDLPKQIGNAVVASEDRTFWTNSGVDLRGIARAFLNNARGGATQGASTLSQQYVERYYMAENTNQGNVVQRYWAKAREAIMALKINRQQEKDEILGNYRTRFISVAAPTGFRLLRRLISARTPRTLITQRQRCCPESSPRRPPTIRQSALSWHKNGGNGSLRIWLPTGISLLNSRRQHSSRPRFHLPRVCRTLGD